MLITLKEGKKVKIMKINNIRTFVPAKNLDVSKKFYQDLGFEILWEGEDLIIFGDKVNNFFLQDFYAKEWAENFMMQIHVYDLEDCFDVASRLVDKYENIKIKEIFKADYGRTFHLIGPSGELWHFTEIKE